LRQETYFFYFFNSTFIIALVLSQGLDNITPSSLNSRIIRLISMALVLALDLESDLLLDREL
jgi:hypothetical protein